MYYRKTDGKVVTQEQLQNENTHISLPSVWTAITLKALNVEPVMESKRPEITPLQTLTIDGCEKDSGGNWVIKWAVTSRFTGPDKSKLEQDFLRANVERMLIDKQNEIRSNCKKAQKANVATSDGNVWNGGLDSANSLEAAIMVAGTAPDVIFYDVNNKPVKIAIGKAKEIVLAIRKAYVKALEDKQNKFDTLSKIDLNQANAIEKINNI